MKNVELSSLNNGKNLDVYKRRLNAVNEEMNPARDLHNKIIETDNDLVNLMKEMGEPKTDGDVDKIVRLLGEKRIKNYRIKNMKVDVDGDVDLSNILRGYNKIPVKFGIVRGNFNVLYNKLISFENSPDEVHGDFWSSQSPVKTLVGLPKIIKGNLTITDGEFTDFTGAPREVGSLNITDAKKLASISGIPTAKTNISLVYTKIKDLNGMQKDLNGNLNINKAPLTSFAGAPTRIGGELTIMDISKMVELNHKFDYIGNTVSITFCPKLENLKGLPDTINGTLVVQWNDKLSTADILPKTVKGNLVFMHKTVVISEEDIKKHCNVLGKIRNVSGVPW